MLNIAFAFGHFYRIEILAEAIYLCVASSMENAFNESDMFTQLLRGLFRACFVDSAMSNRGIHVELFALFYGGSQKRIVDLHEWKNRVLEFPWLGS
uniref:Uncharacterized protein n=1 Tax=Ascaris lumbricoides TaxID=6252 RepID=A0A0M3I1C2_ASCLU